MEEETIKPLPDPARCDAFWAREDVDRPLLSCWVGSFTIAGHYPHGTASLPNAELEPDDIVFEQFRPDYESLFVSHAAIGADVPWAAFPLMTMPWVEAIIGCPIYHRDGNIWAAPWLDTYEALEKIELKADNPWFVRLLELTDWLVELSAGRFPVSMSLMRGPLDLLSALRGPQRMCLDLFDHPEELDEALQRLTNIWIDIARAQLARIPAFEGGYSSGMINLWSREPMAWFQDDALALWSPKYYRRHLRSCEEQLSRCMGVTGIHLHPVSLFVIKDLMAMPELDVIEVNCDDEGPTMSDMIPYLKRTLKEKNLVIWGAFTMADLRVIKEHLPSRGLALQVMAETPDEVRITVDRLRRMWHD